MTLRNNANLYNAVIARLMSNPISLTHILFFIITLFVAYEITVI